MLRYYAVIEIYKNLFIGNAYDYENKVKFETYWFIIHACKEPYHRQALGYSGRGAPRNHPEYLIANRQNRLILNLVDADDYRYIPEVIINAAIEFIDNHISTNKILVHCNQGESRAPSIGLIYLLQKHILKSKDFKDAFNEFRNLYPAYSPAKGILEYIRLNWNKYVD